METTIMHTHIFRVLAAIIFLQLAWSAHAKPKIIYQYGSNTKVIGVNAIVNIEDAMVEPIDNCDQRIADIVVDEVVYERASEIITGFRAKKPAPNEFYALFTIDNKALYDQLPNPQRRDVQRIIGKGARLVVIYQVCGSGGFLSVRDVFKRSAVNNP
jgi:hypothetical protein